MWTINGAKEKLLETISATVNLIKENSITKAEKKILLPALGKSMSSDIYNELIN